MKITYNIMQYYEYYVMMKAYNRFNRHGACKKIRSSIGNQVQNEITRPIFVNTLEDYED